MERHERLGIRHQVLKKLRDAFLYSSEPTFTLSSGRKSRYYIDCKKVTLDPEGAFLIARLVLDAIADDEVDAIGGMTLGADPIAVAVAVVSYQEDRPIAAFVVRKEPKAHGATSYIEGNLPRGSRIVVVDDVLTSGASTERTIGILKEAGCVIVKVLALVDRKEGGRDRLAAAGYPIETLFTIEDLLRRLDQVTEPIRAAVRNHGGGHANHQFFWEILGPKAGGSPKGVIADAITKDFGSFERFQSLFTDAATKQFGSGWAFLVVNPSTERLEIMSLPNQDSVLLHGKPGLLCCDVWEHAYYLKYRNRRPDYLHAWWNVVAWDVVDQRLHTFRAGEAQF